MSSVVTTYPAPVRTRRAQLVAEAVVSAYIREITPTAPRSERPAQPEPAAPSVPAWADAPAASLAISPRRTWTRRTSTTPSTRTNSRRTSLRNPSPSSSCSS